MLKTQLKFIVTIILTLGLSISFQSLLASWQAPSLNPPGGNIDKPINDGGAAQTKGGSFATLSDLGVAGNAFFTQNLTVGGVITGNGSGITNLNWNNISTGMPAGFADGVDNAGVTSETDPQVGSLTSGRWCTSDGAHVNCTSVAPSGGSTLDCYAKYIADWTPTDIASNSRCNTGYELVGFDTSGKNGISISGGLIGDVRAWQFCCRIQ